jgi:hypothetical protein
MLPYSPYNTVPGICKKQSLEQIIFRRVAKADRTFKPHGNWVAQDFFTYSGHVNSYFLRT